MTHTVNGHTPRRFTPAADQPVVSLDKPPAGARLVDPVELVDVDEIEGEVLAEPVDQPDTGPDAGWIAERRARMDAAPRVVPLWLRDRDQFADNVAFVAGWYGREAAFHGVRAPLYVGRLWSGAPRGAGKAARRWFRWVTDAEARPVEAKAALGDPDTWT